jgi:ligand-binding sensor domain-containing protein
MPSLLDYFFSLEKTMKIPLMIIVCILIAAPVSGGVWKNYTNINSISDLDAYGNFVWCATSGGAARWDKKNCTSTSFTNAEGLLSNDLRSVGVDSQGKAWFSYREGGCVACYDGAAFRTYTVEEGAPASFTTLKSGPDGRVWFGCEDGGGVYSFDGKKWESYLPQGNVLLGPSPSIAEDFEGVIWFASERGAWSLKGDVWKNFTKVESYADTIDMSNPDTFSLINADTLVVNNVSSLVVDKGGIKWFGTDRGLFRYNSTNWKAYTKSDGLASNQIQFVAVDNSNTIWISYTSNAGVSCFDGKSWKTYKSGDGLQDNRVVSISVDADNSKWFCHGFGSNSGITSFDGEKWKTFTSADWGIATNGVQRFVVDQKGVKWLITDRGVSSFDGSLWSTFSPKNSGLPDTLVIAIAVDGTNVKWFGTAHGLTSFDGSTWKTYTSKDGLENDAITSLASDNEGALWIGTSTGISVLRDSVFSGFRGINTVSNPVIREIARDGNGALWFATGRGLSRYDGSSWRMFTTADGLYSNVIESVKTDAGGSIVCLTDSLLFIFNGVSFSPYSTQGITTGSPGRWMKIRGDAFAWKKISPQDITVLDVKNKKTFTINASYGYDVSKLLIDGEGIPWIVKPQGLMAIYGDTPKEYISSIYPGSEVSSIAVDSENRKWFCGRFPNQFISRLENGQWTTFNRSTLDSLGVRIMSIAMDSKNTLWADSYYTYYGFVSFDEKKWVIQIYDQNKFASTNAPFTIDYRGVVWGMISLSYQYGANPKFDIIRYDGASWKIMDGLPDGGITSMAVEKNNVKWFMSYNGLSSYNDTTWTFYPKPKNINASLSTMSIDDSGVKWVSTLGNQLSSNLLSFDGVDWKVYGNPYGGGALAIDRDNRKWVGGVGGAACFDGREWTLYSTKDGLVSDNVRAIAIDRDGVKWFGTDHGISSFDDRINHPLRTQTSALPSPLKIIGNYPNPFNPSTTISFTLPETGRASMAIYNISGQKIRELVSSILSAGKHNVVWDGCDQNGNSVSSGVYISRLMLREKVTANRMLLIK